MPWRPNLVGTLLLSFHGLLGGRRRQREVLQVSRFDEARRRLVVAGDASEAVAHAGNARIGGIGNVPAGLERQAAQGDFLGVEIGQMRVQAEVGDLPGKDGQVGQHADRVDRHHGLAVDEFDDEGCCRPRRGPRGAAARLPRRFR